MRGLFSDIFQPLVDVFCSFARPCNACHISGLQTELRRADDQQCAAHAPSSYECDEAQQAQQCQRSKQEYGRAEPEAQSNAHKGRKRNYPVRQRRTWVWITGCDQFSEPCTAQLSLPSDAHITAESFTTSRYGSPDCLPGKAMAHQQLAICQNGQLTQITAVFAAPSCASARRRRRSRADTDRRAP